MFEESAHAPHYEEPERFCEVVRDFALGGGERPLHSASTEVAVPAETAFAYLSDGIKQGEWTLGSWGRERIGEGLFRGASLFDGGETFVRISADPGQLSSTTTSARLRPYAAGQLGPRRPRSAGRAPEGTCVVMLMKWRTPSQDDAASGAGPASPSTPRST